VVRRNRLANCIECTNGIEEPTEYGREKGRPGKPEEPSKSTAGYCSSRIFYIAGTGKFDRFYGADISGHDEENCNRLDSAGIHEPDNWKGEQIVRTVKAIRRPPETVIGMNQ
jgi:hypothetical protein